MREPINIRTVVLRVSALSLLLLLILVATITTRTLARVPNTMLYFVRSEPTRFALVGRARRLPRAEPIRHLENTLAALIAGPTPSENAQGLSSAIPADTEVRGLELRGRMLEVNLSDGFTEGGGSAAMQGRLNQLFYTLTQPSYVESVSLLVDGVPVTYFGGEGIIIDNPWRRSDHSALPTW